MISPETATFAAIVTLFGAGLFTFLLPKVVDHFKDMNYRLLKELIDIRNSTEISDDEKIRFDKIIKMRRKAYLERQENAFDKFFNNQRIDELETLDSTAHDVSLELRERKRTARSYERHWWFDALAILGVITLSAVGIIMVAWTLAKWIIEFAI